MIAAVLLILGAQEALVDPAVYVSRSGEYRLQVEPGARDGAGPGHHVLTRGDGAAWTLDLPYTLCAAVVTDAGVTVGAAFDAGLDGLGGAMHEVVIDGTGRVLAHRTLERTGYLFTQPPTPLPQLAGILLDEARDRAVVRLSHRHGSDDRAWRVLRPSTGELLAELDPVAPLREHARGPLSVWEACAVQDTGLVALHARYGADFTGSLFAVLDLEAHVVWHSKLPDDDTRDGGDRRAALRREDRLRAAGALLTSSGPGAFEVREVLAGRRVDCLARPASDAPTGWVVQAHEPRADLQEAAPRVVPARLTLEVLEPLALDRGDVAPGDLAGFGFDAQGGALLLDRRARVLHGWSADGRHTSATPWDPAAPTPCDAVEDMCGRTWTWDPRDGLRCADRALPRRADGAWFRAIRDVAAGPAGLLVLDPPSLSWFDPDPAPRRTFDLSGTLSDAASLACAGDWAVVGEARRPAWVLVHLPTAGLFTFEPPAGVDAAPVARLVPDASELQALDPAGLRVLRFRMPVGW